MLSTQLTEEEWHAVHTILRARQGGRPSMAPFRNARTVIEGIRYVHDTASSWRQLPERYGNWVTVYSCYRRMRESGLWDEVAPLLRILTE